MSEDEVMDKGLFESELLNKALDRNAALEEGYKTALNKIKKLNEQLNRPVK
jgi:hypothetical protein